MSRSQQAAREACHGTLPQQVHELDASCGMSVGDDVIGGERICTLGDASGERPCTIDAGDSAANCTLCGT